MTDAREIIAQTLGHHPGWSRTTDAILAALTAAGFRIVGPGLLRDIEYVVEIANRNEASPEGFRLAAALRALKEKRPVPERFARLSPDPRAVIPDEASGELTARRPTEQAVTEAMVEAAAKSLRPDLFTPLGADDLRSDDFAWTRREDAKVDALHKARAALKAAMEAGQ